MCIKSGLRILYLQILLNSEKVQILSQDANKCGSQRFTLKSAKTYTFSTSDSEGYDQNSLPDGILRHEAEDSVRAC
ncbi:MAG: hypothetical protein VR64_12220 [Desulfatitalea sp. BRH_c12]|nr:MAG: hypothetical protein VR64_12220 [Desulfatitalea sp. BRH_c12]